MVPTITYAEGKLRFASSTKGAEYHYTITDSDIAKDSYSQDGATDSRRIGGENQPRMKSQSMTIQAREKGHLSPLFSCLFHLFFKLFPIFLAHSDIFVYLCYHRR